MNRAALTVSIAAVLAGSLLFAAILRVATPPPPPPPVVLPKPPAGETPEEIAARKKLFIELLLPLIHHENRQLILERERIDRIERELSGEDEISRDDFLWLKELAGDYELDPAARRNPEFFNSLRKRVDILPASLIIAQAALESGWGRSQIARSSNNFFGHYCYARDCGVPAPGAGDLRRFDSPQDSVHAYMHNINSHPAYKALRQQRALLRAAGKPVTGSLLAPLLTAYSERGAAYGADLATLIRDNDLDALPDR